MEGIVIQLEKEALDESVSIESLCCTGFAINNKVCWCADESS